jgi:hypothetical protein
MADGLPAPPELHPTDRARILELHSFGWGAKRIRNKHPEWKIGTIKYTIRKEVERGRKCASLSRSGRPRAFTEEERDNIYDIVEFQDPNITMPDLLAATGSKVKRRSMQLTDEGIKTVEDKLKGEDDYEVIGQEDLVNDSSDEWEVLVAPI